MGMPRISALDRLALATSSPVPTAAAGTGAGAGSGSGSGMTAGTNKPAQPNTLNIAGIASAAQAQTQTETQTQAKDAAAAGQGDGADQASMSVPKSIKIRRDNRPPPTTLFHRTYSSNGDIKILGSRGKDDDEEKEKEKEEEDEPVVKKGRGFIEKQEDVVMFEPPKESGRGMAVRPSGAGGQGVWRVGMARGMFGPRGAARR